MAKTSQENDDNMRSTCTQWFSLSGVFGQFGMLIKSCCVLGKVLNFDTEFPPWPETYKNVKCIKLSQCNLFFQCDPKLEGFKISVINTEIVQRKKLKKLSFVKVVPNWWSPFIRDLERNTLHFLFQCLD